MKSEHQIQERYCVICGKLIPYNPKTGPKKHNERVVCSSGDDRSDCYREYCRRNSKPKKKLAEMSSAQQKAAKRRQRQSNAAVKSAVAKVENWKPRVKPLLMTDAEQRKIDEDCLARDARRMGLVKDVGRSLADDGIDIKTGLFKFCALWRASEITPIDQIPDRNLSEVDYPGLVQSWCDAGGSRHWARG